MDEELTWRQFQESPSVEDWRVLGEGACAFFRTSTFADGATRERDQRSGGSPSLTDPTSTFATTA